VLALVVGLVGPAPGVLRLALPLLGAVVLVFAATTGVALWRASGRDPTVVGMRLALLGLVGVVGLGLLAGWGHASGRFPGPRPLWLRAHLALGLVVWVGGLLSAVSWQVVPMFTLAAPVPVRARWAVTGAVAASGAGVLVGLALGSEPGVVGAAGLGVLGVGVVHPLLTLRSLAGRRRKRLDPSGRAWQVALAVGLICAGLVVPAQLSADPRPALALGWLAILGWAGLALHGMLSRIVPFLVWFHRFSPLLGQQDVPAMRELLPRRRVRIGLVLHGAAVVLGVVAIGTGSDAAARVTGVALAGTGLWLGGWLVGLLGRRPKADEHPRVSR